MNWIEASQLEIDDVMKVLPHRYPFLLVDRVLEIKTAGPVRVGMKDPEFSQARNGSYARTIKNITINESPFMGHFPGRPIFPGVLTLEAMAQSAVFTAVPFLASLNEGKLPAIEVSLASIDDVRFRKPIRPGDRLEMKVTLTTVRSSIWVFEGEATVDGKRAAEAKFLAHLNLNLGGGHP